MNILGFLKATVFLSSKVLFESFMPTRFFYLFLAVFYIKKFFNLNHIVMETWVILYKITSCFIQQIKRL